MTEKSLWQLLKDVVDCDQKKAALEQALSDAQQGLDKDLAQLASEQETTKDKAQKLLSTQKDAQLNELSIKELKDAEDRKRNKLNNISGQKEYKALESEITTLAKQRAQLEDLVIKQWYSIDQLKEEITSIENTKIVTIERLTADVDEKKNRIASLHPNIAQAEIDHHNAISKLPPEWLTQYNRMKKSVPDPFVTIIGTSCGACFYAIPHHDINKIKRGEATLCHSCYRLLCYNAGTEESATKAEY